MLYDFYISIIVDVSSLEKAAYQLIRKADVRP